MYQQPGGYGSVQQQGTNTSGQGTNGFVPPELSGLNWGAFFFGWIWSIFNGGGALWILIGLFFSPIDRIYLLIKGNEVAWRGKQWESAEAFKATQRKWMMVGLIFFAISIVFACLAIIISVVASGSNN